MMRRSFNQTVGRTMRAVKIPNKCLESRRIPSQSTDVPGKSPVRLSPSKIMNSTQYDYKKVDNQDSSKFHIVQTETSLGLSKIHEFKQVTKIKSSLTYSSVYNSTWANKKKKKKKTIRNYDLKLMKSRTTNQKDDKVKEMWLTQIRMRPYFPKAASPISGYVIMPDLCSKHSFIKVAV